ncbi:MAG: glycosyltransferase [Flavobacteriales bacterium]|nr:glycosyltransferase [Flavobacteriales bacterium]
MAKKSICHVTSVHNWDDIRIFKKQCVSLAKYFDKVHLVAPNGPNGTFNGVNVTCVENKYKGRIKRILYFRKQIINAALKLDADIYQFHDPELLSFVSYFKRKGKIVIYDSHEDVPETILTKKWIPSKMIRKVISSIFDRFEKRIVRNCDGLISVLPEITNKFTCKHTETIYNYPIIQETKKNRAKSVTRLIYVGGLTRIRGIKDICEALNHLDSGYELMLVGKWESEEFRNECHQVVKDSGRLLDKGLVDFETCQTYLETADIGLAMLHKVPNYMNSLPIKAYEYAINQLPTLMSDIPYWEKEFKNFAVFTDPLNHQLIAENIRSIKANYQDHLSNVLSFREKIIAGKNWSIEEQKLVVFYRKIIG